MVTTRFFDSFVYISDLHKEEFTDAESYDDVADVDGDQRLASDKLV